MRLSSSRSRPKSCSFSWISQLCTIIPDVIMHFLCLYTLPNGIRPLSVIEVIDKIAGEDTVRKSQQLQIDARLLGRCLSLVPYRSRTCRSTSPLIHDSILSSITAEVIGNLLGRGKGTNRFLTTLTGQSQKHRVFIVRSQASSHCEKSRLAANSVFPPVLSNSLMASSRPTPSPIKACIDSSECFDPLVVEGSFERARFA